MPDPHPDPTPVAGPGGSRSSPAAPPPRERRRAAWLAPLVVGLCAALVAAALFESAVTLGSAMTGAVDSWR